LDLHLTGARPTAEEKAAVDSKLGGPGSGWEGGKRVEADGRVAFGGAQKANEQRHLLLPVLTLGVLVAAGLSRGRGDFWRQRESRSTACADVELT